ncbi:hypothetical protein FQA39_LY00319 [Lamprigera yunnana]|nr:hypothetical protein FQA39_LY00319 [Lamprigera yunnana]
MKGHNISSSMEETFDEDRIGADLDCRRSPKILSWETIVNKRSNLFEMPSADIRMMSNGTGATNLNALPIRGPEFNISSKDVEGLVLEIKENLRLSTTSMKAHCCHLSRKSSRASPYRVPGRLICTCENNSCEINRKNKRKLRHDSGHDDPYEFLQKLLRDGSLVNEAVRRVQLGLTPKQRYFYESDEDLSSPILKLCPQEN